MDKHHHYDPETRTSYEVGISHNGEPHPDTCPCCGEPSSDGRECEACQQGEHPFERSLLKDNPGLSVCKTCRHAEFNSVSDDRREVFCRFWGDTYLLQEDCERHAPVSISLERERAYAMIDAKRPDDKQAQPHSKDHDPEAIEWELEGVVSKYVRVSTFYGSVCGTMTRRCLFGKDIFFIRLVSETHRMNISFRLEDVAYIKHGRKRPVIRLKA